MIGTETYIPGRVTWEDTYEAAFPDGIPALVLREPERDMGGDYPEPLMTYDIARRVTAILDDPGFVAYAWFGETLVEYRNGYTTGEETVAIVGPDQDGLYAVGHGLLWQVEPELRRGLCRFRHN